MNEAFLDRALWPSASSPGELEPQTPPSRLGNWVLVALMVLFGAFLIVRVAAQSAPGLAIGCDNFGYLRQAELFRVKGLMGGLDTRVDAPEARYLAEVAKRTGAPVSDWYQMIAPHCHHYRAQTDSVILQYPPGTAFLLSLFSPQRDVRSMMVIAAGALAVCACVALAFAPSSLGALATAQFLLAAVLVLMAGETSSSYSVPWTLALIPMLVLLSLRIKGPLRRIHVFLAGIWGLVAALLISVRLANIPLVAAAAILLIPTVMTRERRVPSYAVVTAATIALAIGLVPTLVAGKISTGYFFVSTYAGGDTAPPRLDRGLIESNLTYYIWSRAYSWPLTALSLMAGLITVVAAVRGETRWAVAASAAAVCLFTGLLLLPREVTGPYYWIPSALFVLCLAVFGFAAGGATTTSHSSPALPAAAAAALLSVTVYQVREIPRNSVVASAPASSLTPESIVWSDITSGSLYLYLRKYSGKLPSGSNCMQDRLLKAVYDDRRPQFLVIDSDSMANLLRRLGPSGAERAGEFKLQETYPVYRLLSPPAPTC